MITFSVRSVLSALLASVCAGAGSFVAAPAATAAVATPESTTTTRTDTTPVTQTPTSTDAALFAQAKARGTLRVAVRHVTPPAAPGGRIRTEDRLDRPAVSALAKALNLPFQLVQLTPEQAVQALQAGDVDLALYSLGQDARINMTQAAAPADAAASGASDGAGLTAVPTTYRTFPKAVIRSDTSIHVRNDLAGRSVCLARTAEQAAHAASQAGATLMTFAVPSDALVAVREGQCDLALIDQTVWQSLMRYPEWKKFSATLELADDPRTLTWLLPGNQAVETQWLQQRMQQWDKAGQWTAFTSKWATDVAFDVYMDQEVPDCHS